jgi:UDP-N-acetylmuramoylalanine--D-glutamate ligase
LAGRHNVENALAALLAARLMGATQEACRETLLNFSGLNHRMEWVGEVDGVEYYNDSKATNVGSVVGSLSGFPRKVVLIAGGKDKGGDYAPLLPVVEENCVAVVLIGAATDLIANALGDVVPIHRATSMAHAVEISAEISRIGEAVVLSPACSSFDMFNNFAHRGDVFRAAVESRRTLAE